MATTKKGSTMRIEPLDIGILKIRIIGDTPYLPEPMDEAVLDRYNKKKSNQTYKKDTIPEEEKVKEKYYYTQDGSLQGRFIML